MSEDKKNDIDKIKLIVKSLPKKPGVYKYLDKDGKVIYVGKAKNLKNRVSSYFNNDSTKSGKVKVLVKKICDINYIVVDGETDALLLENTLIKQYQPRYNAMLKDDKTYPWICVKHEPFPRIFSTRKIIKDKSKYYGPYANVYMMNTLLDLIRKLYPIRTCKHNLSSENINKKKFKKCLEYHIDNCKAPCEALQTEQDYLEMIAQVNNILKGNISEVINLLKEKINGYVEKLDFENAQKLKEKLDLLDNYRSKSLVVNSSIKNVDVINIQSDEKYAFVNYMRVLNGAIINAHTVEITKKLDETDKQLLTIALLDLRERFESNANEVIVAEKFNLLIPGIKFSVPQIGDKKHLLELSQRNLKFYLLEREKRMSLIDPERHSKRILNTMQKDLELDFLPDYIECFDNSNIQGDHAVAACVVFRNAKPSKREYRHFNIKTVVGPDDFASMTEVLYRRYKRLKDEGSELPKLIVVDGGKGQLNAAVKSLEELDLLDKIAIIGIAKKLEEIYKPGDNIPLYVKKTSETQKVIQHLRDESHRFGITHHRNKRSKAALKTELTDIAGIGKTLADKLLKEFKSVKRVKEASLDELENCIGKAKGKVVFNWYNG